MARPRSFTQYAALARNPQGPTAQQLRLAWKELDAPAPVRQSAEATAAALCAGTPDGQDVRWLFYAVGNEAVHLITLILAGHPRATAERKVSEKLNEAARHGAVIIAWRHDRFAERWKPWPNFTLVSLP
ncbi:hypothetical protein [Deinococcus ficus]|uniref:Uncharacterized protein n=1 Tax=Deinococcus ficus TaxID=317577 RepID=A0A221T2Z1_9DEIO|nr:hypothetical protein [Deinococcus ficus]ASN83265.1 hypothetical protein DFI_18885 [Deinococcus ficus]